MTVSQEERERAIARSRRMYQTDMQSDIATSEDNGEKEKTLEIARNALRMSSTMPIDDIVKLTGATHDEVFMLIQDERMEPCMTDAINRGKKRKALAVARNALQMGIIIDDIVKLTGLTREEVENLSA